MLLGLLSLCVRRCGRAAWTACLAGVVLLVLALVSSWTPAPDGLPSHPVPSSDQDSHPQEPNTQIQNQSFRYLLADLASESCLRRPVLSALESTDDLDLYKHCHRVFYNRAPKCGSRTVLSTFKLLKNKLNYTVIDKDKPDLNKSHVLYQVDNVRSFVKEFSQYEPPFLYAQHIHYINFTRYTSKAPIFINVIRDPIEGLVSHYYFNMYGSNSAPLATPRPNYNMSLDECVELRKGFCMNIHYIIPFFCGHEKFCRHSTLQALNQAKRVVQESYLVVGLTEDLPAFMELIDSLMPQFFANATHTFKKQQDALHHHYQTVKKQEIKPKTIQILKDHLYYEYDFYEYVKSRFYRILAKVRSIKAQMNKREKRNVSRYFSNTFINK